jgi:hypothetical protein
MIREESDGTPSVCFVVVNWNQRELTLACLESLRRQTYRGFSVVVVDNGSGDDSCYAIVDEFPETRVIELGRNCGIAAANNRGIQVALELGSDYVFILNNDTVVDGTMLTTLVDVAESDRRIGVVGPTMLYYERPHTVWCGGNAVNPFDASTVRLRDGLSLSSVRTLSMEKVAFITSCGACVRSTALRDVGPMDERYFIYYDETDWFARARRRGWLAYYVPNAVMWHRVSATMRRESPATTYYMVRNRLLYIRKHYGGGARVAAAVMAIAQEARTIAAHSVKWRGREGRWDRTARVLALRDAALGWYGEMGGDVRARISGGSGVGRR